MQFKRLYPDCVVSSGHHVWVHNQLEVSVSITCVKFVLCRQASSWSLTISRSFLRNQWVHIIANHVTVITVHWSLHATGENQHESESPNTLCYDLATWQLCLEFFGVWSFIVAPFHARLLRLWSKVLHPHLITGHFTLEMHFSPTETSAGVWQTQQYAVPSSRILMSLGLTGHTLSCPLSVPGLLFQHFWHLCHCWMQYYALQFVPFPRSGLWHVECSHYAHLLAEGVRAAGLTLFMAFRIHSVPIIDTCIWQSLVPMLWF
jgi:hypothetical protein